MPARRKALARRLACLVLLAAPLLAGRLGAAEPPPPPPAATAKPLAAPALPRTAVRLVAEPAADAPVRLVCDTLLLESDLNGLEGFLRGRKGFTVARQGEQLVVEAGDAATLRAALRELMRYLRQAERALAEEGPGCRVYSFMAWPESVAPAGAESEIAVQGPGFLAVELAPQETGYLRGGNLSVNAVGRLHLAGWPLVQEISLPVEAAATLRVETGGKLSYVEPGGEARRELGPLKLTLFLDGARLERRERDGRPVWLAAEAGREGRQIDARLTGRSRPVLVEPGAPRAELATRLALLRRVALATLDELSAPTGRNTVVLLEVPVWSLRYLKSVGQPLREDGKKVVLETLDRTQSATNLVRALGALRERLRVVGENIARAEAVEIVEGQPRPAYRRRYVKIGENGALEIQEDPAPPRGPLPRGTKYVELPNVYVPVETDDFRAALHEYAILTEVLRQVAPEIVPPTPPAVPPPPELYQPSPDAPPPPPPP